MLVIKKLSITVLLHTQVLL